MGFILQWSVFLKAKVLGFNPVCVWAAAWDVTTGSYSNSLKKFNTVNHYVVITGRHDVPGTVKLGWCAALEKLGQRNSLGVS